MKKIICLTLSMCLLLACFTQVAFGADSKLAEGGFYMKSADTGVTVKLQNASSTEIEYKDAPTVKIAENKYARVFEGAVKLTLTIGTEEDAEYLVIMYAGDGDVPTVENTITYINQYHSGDTFIVYPSDMTSQTELKILITSDDESFTNKYVKLGYMPAEKDVCEFDLGNVDGDEQNQIDLFDMIAIARHKVGLAIITDANTLKAADVNLDGVIDLFDMISIARLRVGLDLFFSVQ